MSDPATYKYVNGELVPTEQPCPTDCWHEANGHPHVAYACFRAPTASGNFQGRIDREDAASFWQLAGWERCALFPGALRVA